MPPRHTDAELQGLAREKNPDKADDQEWLLDRRLEAVERGLYNWLRCQESLTFKPEEVIGDLIIIHDELTPDLLQVIYAGATNDHKVRENDFEAGNPRKTFSRVNAGRGGKLRQVAAKTTGLAADFYLPSGLPQSRASQT